MRIVVKVGGRESASSRARHDIARDVADLSKDHSVVLVHGGGEPINAMLDRLCIRSTFHQGRRVTSPEARDVAVMVLGHLGKLWVRDLYSVGQHAMGISGADGGLLAAERYKELDMAGSPSAARTWILEDIMRSGMVPVVASLAIDPEGNEILNVNADEAAAVIAIAGRADLLVFVTEAGGILGPSMKVLPVVRTGEAEGLISNGTVRDGMALKLRSCAKVLEQGIGQIAIVPPYPGILRMVAEGKDTLGTRIVRGSLQNGQEVGIQGVQAP
jgi:acetylglutamate kinase